MAKTIRGTTPTIVFNLPFSADTVSNCEVYFSQADNLIVTKTYEDCVLEGTTLSVTLSQADTLLFDEEEKLEMQIRFVFTTGAVDATNIIKSKVGKILKDGEIDVD